MNQISLDEWIRLPPGDQSARIDDVIVPTISELRQMTSRINAIEHGEYRK